MGNGSSGLSESAKGGDWTSRLHFYDYSTHRHESYTDSELVSNLIPKISENDRVECLMRFNSKLYWLQATKHLLHHKFIIFKSTKWYWSIEKNTKGIYLQRSKSESDIKRMVGFDQERQGVSSDSSVFNKLKKSCTVHDIIRWIYSKDELTKDYHALESNCQHFAGSLHDAFAEDAHDEALMKMGLEY